MKSEKRSKKVIEEFVSKLRLPQLMHFERLDLFANEFSRVFDLVSLCFCALENEKDERN